MEETMYMYILEEENVCKRVLNERKEKIKPFTEMIKNNRNKVNSILFLATGSSVNALNCAKYYIEKMLNMEVKIKMPSAFCNYEKIFDKKSMVIAISQGGKSSSTIEALKKAEELGAKNTAVITGNINSPICKYSKNIIDINCGEEKVGYVTKGFTATVLTLMLIALEGAYSIGNIDDDIYILEIKKFEEVIDKIKVCINKTNTWYESNKEDLMKTNRIKTIGYGSGYGIAMESNTKIAETLRIAVSSFELEEYMHGPYLELKDDHTMIFFRTKGCIEDRLTKLKEYSQGTTPYCYTITYEANSEDKRVLALDYDGDEELSTLLFAIPVQILSYKLAEDRGIPLGVRIFTDFHSCLTSKL